jgi:hypothetical protein
MSQVSLDSSPQSSDSIRLFDDFLQALCDPEGGGRLYQMHAPGAAIRCGDGVKSAADVDPAEFAAAHRDISLGGADSLPRFHQATLLDLTHDADTGKSIAWFQVADAREQLSLPVAVGFVTTPNGLRVGWCTVAPQVKPWSYRDGLLQSLANYPWMRNGTPTPARAIVDAGYFRHCWRAPLTFHTLPDTRFSCMMSAVCCKHDYEITLPAEAQMALPFSRQPQPVPDPSDIGAPAVRVLFGLPFFFRAYAGRGLGGHESHLWRRTSQDRCRTAPPRAKSTRAFRAVRGATGGCLSPRSGRGNSLGNLEASDTPILARILRNTLFSKVYSYQFDLTTAHNFLIVLYLLALLMQAAAPDGVLSDVMWQELGSLGVHGLLMFLLHEGVPDGFRATFGTAEFGQWMLAT